ncbi:MAG: CRISPR-associated protein Cas6, partial [Vulcanisaeta sp.]|nr:CRISPR-associated protein Cas6 [Vulcanisaeta sp.]
MLGLGLTITFTVDWEVRLRTWGGRFLNRLVGEALENAGVRTPHNGAKPYTISPILNASGRIVNRLVPGTTYWFRASFMCNMVDCNGVVGAFVRDSYRLGSGEVVRVLRVRAREFRPSLNGGSSGSNNNNRSIIEWGVGYYPTVFAFARHYITHPSPARFLTSAAKTLAQLLRNTEVTLDGGGELYNATINNINIKGLVMDLTLNTEATKYRVRRLRVDLGGGRVMPAFRGVAEYVTYTENVGLFNALLDVA